MRELDEALLSVLNGPGVPIWVDEAIRDIRPDRILVDAQSAAQTVRPMSALLDLVGDQGVELTAAGYLRPKDVRTLLDQGDYHPAWTRGLSRESDVAPILFLRNSATDLKLTLRRKGRLTLTKKGKTLRTDPVALWWHIADALPLDHEGFAQAASVTQLLAQVAAERPDDAAVTDTLYDLGWRTADGGPPPRYFGTRTDAVLRSLGLIPGWIDGARDPARRARTFARAALSRPVAADPAESPDLPPSDCLLLTVTLDGTDPPVWRRITVPVEMSLADLHNVLQGAMGWTNSHLHEFTVDGVRYGVPDPDWDADVTDETTTTVGQALRTGAHTSYVYDFGDGWQHTITVDDRVTASATPRCLAGARACPPEDVGGVFGYQEFLDALYPHHPEHGEAILRVRQDFDPDRFSPEEATHEIARELHGTEMQRLTHFYNQL